MSTHQYQAPQWAVFVDKLVRYIQEDFFGGKKFIPLAWAINFHKLSTIFIIFAMMYYFDNFSIYAWIYLALHGTYGYCWMIKDLAFRDGSFESLITVQGGFLLYPMLIGWYWFFPYWFISQRIEPSHVLLFSAVGIHTLGVALMIAADCQKYFTLKYRKGLFTDGVFKYTRNPNFLGEMMIYAGYALLANHWLGYLILAYACIYFFSRMLNKDASISRHAEWESYRKQSSLLIPWKFIREFKRV